MIFHYLLILFIILTPIYLKNSRPQIEFVVWNVGQGQWTTLKTETDCLHFDMGGEKNLTNKVSVFCTKRMNRIWLSHWDYDHVSFVRKFSSKNQSCLEPLPGRPPTAYKKDLIENIPPCKQISKAYTRIHLPPGLNGNESSQVALIQSIGILIPGDSPLNQENIWSQNIGVPNTQGLVLGHHGSRTSTGTPLLNRLTKTKWAVASARKSRYGHPHPEVIKRLQDKKIPILLTEEWGSLHFHYHD